MTFAPSEEHELLRTTVRRFIRKEIWLWERRGEPNAIALPPDVFANLHAKIVDMGLDNLTVPDGYPGPDLDLPARMLVVEEIAQHRAGVLYPAYGLFGADVPPQLFAATPAQRAQFLDPLLRRKKKHFRGLDDPAGTDAPTDGVRIRARWMGQEWMLDGTKQFVSGADGADFGIIYARTEAEDGTARGISAFVVESDRPGFQWWRPYATISAGRDTMEINLSNLRLPPDHLLGEVGAGPDFGDAFLARAQIVRAATLTGIAAAAHDMAHQQSNARRVRQTPLSQSQAVRSMIVDTEIAVRAARLLTRAAASHYAEGLPFHAETALANLAAADAAALAVENAIQIHGAPGLSADLPLERWLRDLHVRALEHGGNEARRAAAAQHLLTTFRK